MLIWTCWALLGWCSLFQNSQEKQEITFDGAYESWVDQWLQDYRESLSKLAAFENLDQSVTYKIKWNFGFFQADVVLGVDIKSLNPKKSSNFMEKMDLGLSLSWAVVVPLGMSVENVSFNWKATLRYLNDKLYAQLEDLQLDTMNPELAVMNTFVQQIKGKWILLIDPQQFDELWIENPLKNMSFMWEIYDDIDKIFDILKQHKLFVKIWESMDGDTYVYDIQLNKNEIYPIFNEIMKLDFFSKYLDFIRTTSWDDVELPTQEEFNEVLNYLDFQWKMKVKDLQNIGLGIDSLKVYQDDIKQDYLEIKWDISNTSWTLEAMMTNEPWKAVFTYTANWNWTDFDFNFLDAEDSSKPVWTIKWYYEYILQNNDIYTKLNIDVDWTSVIINFALEWITKNLQTLDIQEPTDYLTEQQLEGMFNF